MSGRLSRCARWAVIAGFGGFALLLSSCEEDEAPLVCPTYNVGAVEGYVRVAGEGRSLHLGARAQEGHQRGEVVAQVQSDSTGWYRFELPTGLYRIETDPDRGILYTSRLVDTVSVTPTVKRFDLARGSLAITIRMPPDLEGEFARLRVRSDYFPSPGSVSERVRAEPLLFAFPVLPPGTYKAQMEIGNSARVYLPGVHASEDAALLEVGSDRPVTYEASFEESLGSIAGTVTGSWQAVPGARVSIEAYSADSIRIARDHSYDDGTFRLLFPVAEPVRFLTEIEGLERWVGGDSFADAEVYPVGPGDRLTGVTIRESGIRIDLEGPADPSDYEATVHLLDAGGRTYELGRREGNPMYVCNLPPGSYRLHLCGIEEEQLWASQWYDGTETMSEATPIELGEGELATIHMVLVEGGRIEGRVGTLVDPASYYVRLHTTEDEPASGWRRYYGEPFSFTGLPNGRYYLAASTYPSQGVWWYPGTGAFEEAVPIEIADHDAVSGIEWSLPGKGKRGEVSP